MCNCLGVPPKSFDFEYVNKNKEYKIIKNIKVTEFLQKYINFDIDNYCSIINYPTAEKPFKNTYSIKSINTVIGEKENIFLNLEWNRLEKMMIEQLQNGEIIYASCENGKYMNKKMGIWNEKQYDYDSLFEIDTTMSKGDMLDTKEAYFCHSMLITGVELEDGKPIKWKIKNSWGIDNENKGYWIATNSWIKMYLYQISINNSYLTKEEKNLLENKPIELNIWDPLAELL